MVFAIREAFLVCNYKFCHFYYWFTFPYEFFMVLFFIDFKQ